MRACLNHLRTITSRNRNIFALNQFTRFKMTATTTTTVAQPQAAPAPASAIDIVDSLINKIKSLKPASAAAAPTAANANAKQASTASQKQSAATASPKAVPSGEQKSSKRVPSNTAPAYSDLCWTPEVGVGHTPYTYYGETPDKQQEQQQQQQRLQLSPKQISMTNAATREQLRSEFSLAAKQPQAAATAAATGDAAAAPQQPRQPKQKPASQPGGGKKGSNSAPAVDPLQPLLTRLDVRVGRILSAVQHHDADSLYVEQIDVGEAEPRQIVSGLVKYITLPEMQNRLCLVVCNLKPSALRGVQSAGMVLAASNADHTQVELVEPHADAVPGQRVGAAGIDLTKWTPEAQINPKKANSTWEQVKPLLAINAEGVACFDGKPFQVDGKANLICKSKSLKTATIS